MGKGKSVGKEGNFTISEVLLQKIEVRDTKVCEHTSTRINVLVGWLQTPKAPPLRDLPASGSGITGVHYDAMA